QACSLQKLFSVEGDFEDEDFLSAVEEAEIQFSDPVPVNPRCLRPLASGLRAPSSSPASVQQLHIPGASSTALPVLGLQNPSKLRIEAERCASTSRLRPENDQIAGPSRTAFKNLKEPMAVATVHGSNHPSSSSSAAQFKFVSRRTVAAPTQDAPLDDVFDKDLFLTACMELDGPNMQLNPGLAKSCFQLADSSPKLALRPSTAGSCYSHSSLATSAGSVVNPVPQGVASWGTHSPSPSPCPSRALHSPGSSSPRFSGPQALNQSCSTARSFGSSWQPLTHLPANPWPLTCVESTARVPRLAAAETLQTPVVTNHLVQLVTAANKTPSPSARVPSRVKTRRFPGPAGILPQQLGGKNLDEILISTPQIPAHGALAKLRTEGVTSSQQPVEEDFGRGPWVAMKTELGLDERDPSCFLRTYSVVMVLRKAVLKQLPKNKVPKMAVMIRSLTRTSTDAGAVFKDLTGEIQGTVHHLLLEENQSELKAGSVLLLKQVSVFSPSHRNHYLNVTPSNLVKIYPLDLGDVQLSQQLCGEVRQRTVTAPSEAGRNDLDGLLGELPEDFFSARESSQWQAGPAS
uniref:Homologous recombination factor with OB-fold n=1 Tax=Sphenodon punctatus TaxID=8508 RepID=A0A8D0H6I3_SPHPU